MFEIFADPSYSPFAIAGAIVAAVACLEVLALVLGITVFDAIDNLIPGIDMDVPGSGGVFSWLGFGKAPFLVVLIVILGMFSVSGTAIQLISEAVMGSTLWPLLAIGLATAVTLPTSSYFSQLLARVIPSVESSSVTHDSFVGREGQISQGVATEVRWAEAQVVDDRGLTHWIRVRAETGETLNPSDQIRIIGRCNDHLFIARAVAPE